MPEPEPVPVSVTTPNPLPIADVSARQAASDRVQIALAVIALVGTMFATAFGGTMTYMMARLAAQQSAAAVKVERVRETLQATATVGERKLDSLAVRATARDKKIDNLATVAKSTHLLVNSNMGVQLRLNKIVARRLADLTMDPADIEAANLAEGLFSEHMKGQARVDAQPGTDAAKKGAP